MCSIVLIAVMLSYGFLNLEILNRASFSFLAESLCTTDFVEKGTNIPVFRTCHEERNQVVFQMGASNAVRALAAAQIVCKDVAAIDINMGCPKSFSLSGGMGAALLSGPELIHDILTTLKMNLNTAITCKIRLLRSSQDTVELARRIEKTSVSALAVHGRYSIVLLLLPADRKPGSLIVIEKDGHLKS